jgi:TRAP-type C4-dicarboxylate transport system permease small subunit
MMWVLMLGTVAGVVARSILKVKFTGFFEFSAAYLFIGIVMLVLGVLQAKDEHIRITLLVERSGPRGRAAWGLFAYSLGAVVCATVAYYAWSLLIESIRTGALVPALVDLPLWVSRLLIFTGYAAWTIHFLRSASIAWSRVKIGGQRSGTSIESGRSLT